RAPETGFRAARGVGLEGLGASHGPRPLGPGSRGETVGSQTLSSVPEPASLILLAMGLAGISVFASNRATQRL
ncbi:MAG: PEP-CTERM sorting domain-containing protein, partial [Isosphaeraceae bacterium]